MDRNDIPNDGITDNLEALRRILDDMDHMSPQDFRDLMVDALQGVRPIQEYSHETEEGQMVDSDGDSFQSVEFSGSREHSRLDWPHTYPGERTLWKTNLPTSGN